MDVSVNDLVFLVSLGDAVIDVDRKVPSIQLSCLCYYENFLASVH